jgi:hypothetical protein
MPSGPAGRTGCVQGDLRDPAAILADPVIRDVLDLAQPVALLLLAVLPFVPDGDGPGEAITALLDALPAGSYVAASHPTAEHDPQGTAAVAEAYRKAGIPVQFRDSYELLRRGGEKAVILPSVNTGGPGTACPGIPRADGMRERLARSAGCSTPLIPAGSRVTSVTIARCLTTCSSAMRHQGPGD